MSEATAPQLRQLGIGEILDVAMKIVWRNAGTLVRLVIFIVLPVQVVSALVLASAASNRHLQIVENKSTGSLELKSAADVKATIAALLIVGLLSLISSVLVSGACFRAVATAYLGERTGWRASLGFALRRFRSLLWLTFLSGLIFAVGFVLCVIPGVYLWVGFSVAVPVLLTEGLKGRKALGRSRELVKGFWWRAFAVVVLGYLLSVILSSAISAVVVGLSSVSSHGSSIGSILVNIVSGTVSKLLTAPFIAAFVTVLYFDLRVRKEAFDLQLLADRIGVEPPAGALSTPAARLDELPGSDQPPFWPPPPGWKPGGGGSG